MCRAHLLLMTFVMAASVGFAAAQSRIPVPEATPVFRLSEPSRIPPIEISTAAAPDSGRKRQAVTDVLLRIPPGALSAPTSEMLPRGQGGSRQQLPGGGFFVELIVAAGGRLYAEERVQCTPWSSELSRCRARCDGGGLAIARLPGDVGVTLQLILGEVEIGSGAGSGFRFAACADRDGAEINLVPAR